MFLFMEDRHSIDLMNRPDANVIPQSWETQPVLQPSNLCAVEYKMKFFTEQWYYSGCPRVPEYEAYAKSIAEKRASSNLVTPTMIGRKADIWLVLWLFFL